ncbi:MAG: HAMP domain-containing protein [Chloroflexi bacterium]|nr:HAMP domain-containing protein [Chloroflexota bacterium]
MKSFFATLPQSTHSIRFRLVLWFALILTLVLTIFSVFIYISQARELRSELSSRLEGRMEELEHDLHVSDPYDLATATNGQEFLSAGEVLVLFDTQGEVTRIWGQIDEDQITELVQAQLLISDETILFEKISTDGASVDYGFRLSPRLSEEILSGFVLIGGPLDPGHRLGNLTATLVMGSLATLVIALLGGFWLADRAMRPVADITRTAREISETDLSHRLNLNRRDEIGQLADTFDAMLARLQAAFERQRQFTADASHELRTPLTIVNLEVNHALAAPRKPAEYQRALGIIQSENEFMGHLVNDLLLLARMDAGQGIPSQEKHDLSEIALEVLERLGPLAARRQVQLEAGDFPETPVQGDRQYLIQMLSNLIENAIKHTSLTEAGREHVVQIETGVSSEGTHAWVRVSDDGPGIPEEHLPHLFERFYRVDQARAADNREATSASGSGLGLSIVQWIAQAHGGKVSVESAVGKGASFTVTLPLAK